MTPGIFVIFFVYIPLGFLTGFVCGFLFCEKHNGRTDEETNGE